MKHIIVNLKRFDIPKAVSYTHLDLKTVVRFILK